MILSYQVWSRLRFRKIEKEDEPQGEPPPVLCDWDQDLHTKAFMCFFLFMLPACFWCHVALFLLMYILQRFLF